MFFFSFQIEDAMLMFDKQTNRHRGKCFGIILSHSSLSLQPKYIAIIYYIDVGKINTVSGILFDKTLKKSYFTKIYLILASKIKIINVNNIFIGLSISSP